MLILFINCHSFFLSFSGIIVYKGRGRLDVVKWGENAMFELHFLSTLASLSAINESSVHFNFVVLFLCA